jgi:hypothetical protein
MRYTFRSQYLVGKGPSETICSLFWPAYGGEEENFMFLLGLFTVHTTSVHVVYSMSYLSNAMGSNCDSSLED